MEWCSCEMSLAVGLVESRPSKTLRGQEKIGFLRNCEQESGMVGADL